MTQRAGRQDDGPPITVEIRTSCSRKVGSRYPCSFVIIVDDYRFVVVRAEQRRILGFPGLEEGLRIVKDQRSLQHFVHVLDLEQREPLEYLRGNLFDVF